MSKQTYSKSKGREAENAVVEWLRQAHGIAAERRRQTGVADCGDVSGWPCVTVECKAEKRLNLPGYMDELAAEVANCEKRYGAPHLGLVMAKRRGKGYPGDWYALMPADQAVVALKALLIIMRQNPGALDARKEAT